MAPRNKKKLSREEILKNKREAEKARLLRIKSDPIKLAQQKEKERLKYLNKKAKGQRKSIKEMTAREQRITRKKWKVSSSTYRKNQALKNITNTYAIQNTPPTSDDEAVQIAPEEHRRNINRNLRAEEARRRSQKLRKMRLKELKQKDHKISKLKAKLNAQRQKCRRLKNEIKVRKKRNQLTPKSKIEQMAEDIKKKKELVKKALFGEVMKTQLEDNYSQMKTHQDRLRFKRAVSGKIVDKYKLWRIKNRAITYKKCGHNCTKKIKTKTTIKLKEIIEHFFEDDSNSRQSAGKKEFLTRKNIKKQKRYLMDTLKNLHNKFLKTEPLKISYSIFCRLRPFWVVPPTLSGRDTCLCIVHENIDLKLAALKSAKILAFSNHQIMLQIFCCDRYSERCLGRTCTECCSNKLPYAEFNNNKAILYKQWVNKKEAIIDHKTKKERFVTKYKKEENEILPRDLILKLENDVQKFFQHELNIVHQYNAIKSLKKSLTEKDAIIHMDFSENFATKYNQEIQAVHFGGSRTQITLHTVVVYLKDSTNSHCTISTNLSHNVGAIWAHLRPVLASLPLSVEHLHFLSDGPVTQYRNKAMFFILCCKLSELYPRYMKFSWNYHEAGHGKGAPDGIGATCKRTADKVIATGGDITNLKEFVDVISERCPTIRTAVIEESDIERMNNVINENQSNLVAFKGTLLVHQVTGNTYHPNRLVMKSLSCFCNPDGCDHYKLGIINYKQDTRLNVSAVFTDSEEDMPVPGISDILKDKQQDNYSSGEYVLVKFLVRKTEYHYAAVCSGFDEEDGELTVTFLKLCNSDGTLFKLDAKDVADVSVDQVIKKLPVPNVQIKGKRVFYKFNETVDVFEK